MTKKVKKDETRVESFYNGKTFVQYGTSDLKKAIEFYQNGLGLDLSDFSKNGPNPEEIGLVEFNLPSNGSILTLSKPPGGKKVDLSDNLVIMVTGIDKLHQLLIDKQISASDVKDVPNLLSFFTIKDFEGNNITFMSEPRNN